MILSGFLAAMLLVAEGSIRPTRLLPTDGSIVHCAGQTNQNLSDTSIHTFDNYTNYLSPGTRPMVSMVYFGVTLAPDVITEWFKNYSAIMNRYDDSHWYGIQIGLWFYDVNGNEFDCQLGNGTMDANIDAMVKGFNVLGRPVWLRIGYEFNGQWTHFKPACYKAAFQRITKKLRADPFCNKHVATVWDYTADSEYVGHFEEWYPGDDVVDWWGVNVFGLFNSPGSVPSNAGIGSPYINQFIEAAVNKSFPVMLGETAPRQVGGNAMPNGCAYKDSWNAWFQPYFNMINNASMNIRAFCYINWNWWAEGYNWGQGEINLCPAVGPNYQKVLTENKGPYANAQSKDATLKLLGIN